MVDKNFYRERYVMTDLLLASEMSKTDMAKYFDISIPELNRRLKLYGLGWVKTRKRKMSRGQASIVDVLQRILPGEKIEFEHHLGDRLRLDIFVPRYNIGIEYHGRQHFEWVSFFHETEADFEMAQQRDLDKIEKCKEQGIVMVVFRYNDSLDEDSVFNRILSQVRESEPKVRVVKQVSGSTIEFRNMIKESRARMRKDLKKRREEDVEYQQQRDEFKRLAKERRREWHRARPPDLPYRG